MFRVNSQHHSTVCAAVVCLVGGKMRHATGSNMATPTYVEPSAPPMTSSSDHDVTHHGQETASAPLCRRCGAAMSACGDVVELPPPSYELSQQLQTVSHLS